jgi:L-alanine-DL-glutamate epimerase-like enolase superfamily enzyme
VQWVWPSEVSYALRDAALQDFCRQLARAWVRFDGCGHALEIGHDFQQTALPELLARFNHEKPPAERMPLLAALVCCSPFDLALHDAYGMAQEISVYETYNRQYMNRDLSRFLSPADDAEVNFAGKYPADYLTLPRVGRLPVWHLVGGLDPIVAADLNGDEPDDGEPVLLEDWIDRDGITCLKVKLRGDDDPWDYHRLVQVSQIAKQKGPFWLTADFNCTVTDPGYVNSILDRLQAQEPAVYDAILYVEQPFPYDLENHRIDVRSVSSRKPLLMDESAHHWELVRLGRSLGWTGVALKTCKTQTGALLSLCWAKAHGMQVMVQDLTNPMLAQIPHLLLAAHADTMMGVESNAMQFYPSASAPEALVHPGLYHRRQGQLDLSSIHGPGFGYRIGEIERQLGAPAARFGVTR